MSSTPRFFVPPGNIRGRHVRFLDYQATQIGQVLRLRAGDAVVVLDDSGMAHDVVLDEVGRGHAAGTVHSRYAAGGEPETRVTLYQSLLKRDKFEWVLQKATEIGVAGIVPVITRRTLVRDTGDVTPEKQGRWERIILEAAEQSGRGRLPELAGPLPFMEALDEAKSHDRTLLAHEGEREAGVRAALAGLQPGASLALFVGPEGGFDAEEVALAEVEGAAVVTLGSRVLRTETAAAVALALALYELGDMG